MDWANTLNVSQGSSPYDAENSLYLLKDYQGKVYMGGRSLPLLLDYVKSKQESIANE